MKKLLILICLISLFLTACSGIRHDRADDTTQMNEETENDMTQMKAEDELEKEIETAKEDVITYLETHKQLLTALSQELLQIMHEKSNVDSINVHYDRAVIELHSSDGTYSTLPIADFPNLDELLSTVESDASPFDVICASSVSEGDYFDSPTCCFGMSIRNNEQLYYNIELHYTEDANAVVMIPEMTEQLEPHWYMISHYWY